MPVHPLMSIQPMRPYVAARHYNSGATPSSHFPLVTSLSHGQSYIPVVQMSPANPANPLNQLPSVPATIQNPFSGQPMVRYDWQTQQQLLQQQFFLRSAAAAGGNHLQPFVVSGMPLVTRQTVPASGSHAGPTVNAVYRPPSLRPEVYKTVECRDGSMPSNRHIQATLLPAEADSTQFAQKELQTASVSKRDGTLKNLSVPLQTDTPHALPLSSRSRPDCERSPETRLCTSVTETSWSVTGAMNAGNSASVCSEDSPLGYSRSEANSLVTSVKNIIEQQTVKETGVSSWLNNAVCQDDVWTKPADAKHAWSSRADSRLDTCQISSTEHSHTFQPSSIGSALVSDSAKHFDRRTAEADQGTVSTVMSNQFSANAADSGYDDQPDIWPTSFGPFTLQSDCSSASVCRLPPGLETQVLAKHGVIGQRVSEMQKNASVEGSDSGVESVNGDSQGPVTNCSSSELSLPSSSSSETVVTSCLRGAREHESACPSQNPSTTDDDSVLTDTSLLVDVLSAVIAQITPRDLNVPQPPTKSSPEAELKTVSHHSYHSSTTGASEDQSCLTSVSSHEDVGSTQGRCENGSSQQPAPDSVGQMLNTDTTERLADAITQLCGMLSKPRLIRELLHSVDDRRTPVYNETAASTAVNCSSQDARPPCETPTSRTAGSLPDQHGSACYDPVSVNARADGQDERSLVDRETYVSLSSGGASTCDDTFCRTIASNTSTSSDLQTLLKHDASAVSCNNEVCTATSQNDCSCVNIETNASFPVSLRNACSGNSAANQDISLTDSSQVHSEPAMEDLLASVERWKL